MNIRSRAAVGPRPEGRARRMLRILSLEYPNFASSDDFDHI